MKTAVPLFVIRYPALIFKRFASNLEAQNFELNLRVAAIGIARRVKLFAEF